MHPSDLPERLEDPARRLTVSDRQEAAAYIREMEQDRDRLRRRLLDIARAYPCDTVETMRRCAREALPANFA